MKACEHFRYIAVFFLGYRKPSKVYTYSEPEVIRRKNAVTFLFLRVVRSDFQVLFVSVQFVDFRSLFTLLRTSAFPCMGSGPVP